MIPPRWRGSALPIVALAAAAGLFGLGSAARARAAGDAGPAPAAPAPLAAALARTDDAPGAACRDCHPAIVEDYRASGMARALGPLLPGELEGLAPVRDAAGGALYRLESAGAAGFLRESRGSGPAQTERAVPLAFAIGAGIRDRSFAALESGRLWFAPLEVVTAPDRSGGPGGSGGTRHAALAPPHAITPGLGLGQPITPECLACHTDALPPRAFPLNLAPDEGLWRPRGISCAACHARAREHVAWREAALAGEEPPGADPVLDPGSLGQVERLSICAACHLQGDARIELVPGALGPPTPGGDLLAARAVFVAAQPTDEIGFVSHVERLALSRCFLASEGPRAMSCETCHDPHRALAAPGERARTRAACLACHRASDLDHGSAQSSPSGAAPFASACSLADRAAKQGRDCASCHLRETQPFDVAGVTIHDHFVRRRPGPPSQIERLRFPESPSGDWKRFLWPGVEPPPHADDPGLLLMALAHGGHLERALALAATPPGPAAARLPMYHHVRGSLLERAGRGEEAARAYRAALALDPELAEAASNLGLLLGRLGRPAEGLALLDPLLERHPLADGALANRALLHRALGRPAEFQRDAEAAFRLRPRPELALALARWHAEAGRSAEARRWTEEARRLDPGR